MKTISDIQTKSDLPDNLEALQNFSWELVLHYNRLLEKYRKLIKMEFGKSSERIIDAGVEQMQLDTLLNELSSVEAQKQEQPPEETYTVPAHTKRKKHPGRTMLPEGIEKKIMVHDVPDAEKACCNCHKQMDIIEIKKHITIERTPAQYKATEHHYPVYGCSDCKETVVKAQPCLLPISKGIAEVGLLCFVIFSKYLYHLPLYRIQRQIFHESGGIWFSRQTMVGWIRRIAGLLQRIYDELLKVYAMSRIKHADDTPIPVQRVQQNREVRCGYMWAGVGGSVEPVAVFVYDDHRNSEAAQRLLKGSREGDYLMIDDCPSFNKAIKEFKLLPMLCMAHCRRQFVDAVSSGWQADFSRTIIRQIGHLYRIERFADTKKLDIATRHAVRQKASKPILDKIKKLLMDPGFIKVPGAVMSNAIDYMLNNWERVVRYLEAGDLPIDNNILERLIRMLVIGRNNWIKVGSENGAQWMAIIYSIIATCKLNGVNPHEYLPDILMRLIIRPNDQSVKDLLPAEWKRAHANNGSSMSTVHYPKN